MLFSDVINGIEPINVQTEALAQAHWDRVAKPLGGLGLLEDAVVRLAAVSGDVLPSIDRRHLLVCCADNGVVDEGCTQTDSSVTLSMALALAEGRCCVCVMAEAAGVQVIPADMGMQRPLAHPKLLDLRVAAGTKNIAIGPAMTAAEAEQAILSGVSLVRQSKEQGANILLTGELGIGNTTTSSAMAAVLLGMPPDEAVGRGAGLSDEGLLRKRQAVQKAIATNQADAKNPIDVLAKLGGFDIAGLVGIVLGAGYYGLPVVLDGVISCVAALVAVRLAPHVQGYLLASHQSAEPAGGALLAALGLKAPIHAGMRLGEGTGAVALVPMLDMALKVYKEAATFDAVEVTAYEKPQKERPSC